MFGGSYCTHQREFPLEARFMRENKGCNKQEIKLKQLYPNYDILDPLPTEPIFCLSFEISLAEWYLDWMRHVPHQ